MLRWADLPRSQSILTAKYFALSSGQYGQQLTGRAAQPNAARSGPAVWQDHP